MKVKRKRKKSPRKRESERNRARARWYKPEEEGSNERRPEEDRKGKLPERGTAWRAGAHGPQKGKASDTVPRKVPTRFSTIKPPRVAVARARDFCTPYKDALFFTDIGGMPREERERERERMRRGREEKRERKRATSRETEERISLSRVNFSPVIKSLCEIPK